MAQSNARKFITTSFTPRMLSSGCGAKIVETENLEIGGEEISAIVSEADAFIVSHYLGRWLSSSKTIEFVSGDIVLHIELPKNREAAFSLLRQGKKPCRYFKIEVI